MTFRAGWGPTRFRAALLAAALLAAACDSGDDGAAQAPAPPPPAVTVVAAATQDVTPAATFTGRVEAVDQVDLRARVEGFLERRLFTEGDDVREGELLFTIEKGRYEAAVAQAQANVARAEASLKNAELQLARANELVKNRNIPTATRDDRQAERDAAVAELAAQKAALQTAQLNLGYTDIVAPIAGRIGQTAYTQGNLVNPASGTLATIVSEDPIYVTFPVSSRELLAVREGAAEEGSDPKRFAIRLRLPNGELYEQAGTVNFVDVRTDPSTDTVEVRAQFPNPRGLLVPGALVGVIAERAEPERALVVPQAAVLNDQGGSYVLLVDGQSKVEQRRVELGPVAGSDIAVRSGLKEGERVITEGLQKVRPGQVVQAAVAAPTQQGA